MLFIGVVSLGLGGNGGNYEFLLCLIYREIILSSGPFAYPGEIFINIYLLEILVFGNFDSQIIEMRNLLAVG